MISLPEVPTLSGRSTYQSLVEFGLARFQTADEIQITEPLTLISIIRYLESKGKTLGHNIRTHFQVESTKGLAFEEAVLWAMTQLLQNGRSLVDILEFEGTIPGWAHCTAQIVARSSDQFVDFNFITNHSISPTASVTCSAKGVDEVKSWLKTGGAGWCVPGNLMGPDLMARVRLSNGKIILLVIQAKCHLSGNDETLPANVAADAIRTLIPRKWYHSIVCRSLSSPVSILIFPLTG